MIDTCKFLKRPVSILTLSISLELFGSLYAAAQNLTDSGVAVEVIGREVTQINGVDTDVVDVNNRTQLVDQFTPLDSYGVRNGGVLNVGVNGVVDGVRLSNSMALLLGGTVLSGIDLTDSFASVDSSVVKNKLGMGLRIASYEYSSAPGSKVIAKDSEISGVGTGAGVGIWGELLLVNTNVIGEVTSELRSTGVTVASGKLVASERSFVLGEDNGIRVYDGTYKDGLGDTRATVILDDSVVKGLTGAAIKIGDPYAEVTTADIVIKNGSELYSGNGNLVEINDASIVSLTVDNSLLAGNITADGQGSLDVVLQNSAQLSGNIVNSDRILVRSSVWQLLADNTSKELALQSGHIRFAGDGFHTLSLGELSGNGTFDMRINLDAAQGDLLQVNGQATGSHLLNVKNTGVEVVPAEFDPLRIVHTEGGDARFGLIGNRVDLGAYSYLLEKQGNDWFIVGEGKTISPSTQSALALFNAAPAIWNSELTTLRSRMGEVRGQEEGGGWIRSYGNRFNASTGADLSYRQKQQGMSFGADAPIPVANGNLVMGLMGGYSKSDLDLSGGSSGTVNSYYVGAYGTWLLDEGYYLDGVLKFNRFRNDSKVAMSDGGKAKGRYNNEAVGASIEFGKHIQLADDYFVEPYTQLSGVSIGGDSYSLSNGMKAKNSSTQSVLGKVGTTAGRNFALDDGSIVQPYVRVAMAHEFARSNDVTVNEAHFDNNLFGSRAELGAGVAVSLSKRLQLHADFDYMKGKHVEQPWGANLGVTFAF